MEPTQQKPDAAPQAATVHKTLLSASGTDPNKILPIKYNWARAHYRKGVANNWTPEEVPMQDDIELWKKPGGLSDAERRLILWNMGFFSTAESLTANNIVLAVYRHLTNPECRQYLLRQAYEEAVHTDTFIYCCDSLGLDPEQVYTMYLTIPNIAAKDDYVVDMTKSIFSDDFKVNPNDPESVQRYVHDLVGYYVIMEGIFFYAGFVMMLSFKRQNRMIGVGTQFEYILRDESVHLAFGSDLINSIVDENPSIWTQEFQTEITENIKKAVELEHQYAKDCLPEPLLGLNESLIRQYLEYIADRRLERIRLPKVYGSQNPFPWMSEIMDLKKEKNFFETRVTEYQTAGNLDW